MGYGLFSILKGKKLILWLALFALLYWSGVSTKFSLLKLWNGLEKIFALISRMLPPKWSVLPEVLLLAVETIQIAIVATAVSLVVSIPLSFLAAKNITPHPVLYHIVRNLLNFLRGVPELIFALLFVTAVGLGPFAGVLALAVHTTGVLGKIFAEYIEGVSPGPQEAILATGASSLQVIMFGILPQIIPAMLAMTFYRFEVNVRSATVLGFVGAGGIGFYLLTAMRLLNYSTAITCIIVILVMVSAIDYLGSYFRFKAI
jgi:phosphonate transport system permease protein